MKGHVEILWLGNHMNNLLFRLVNTPVNNSCLLATEEVVALHQHFKIMCSLARISFLRCLFPRRLNLFGFSVQF